MNGFSVTDAINDIKARNDGFARRFGRRPLVFCRTFGCQMNARDSERIVAMCLAMGYDRADDEACSDLIIFNTCCVRGNAENKIYGNLGWLKRVKEDRRKIGERVTVAVCGCMTQQDGLPDRLRRERGYVDIIFGTMNIHKFPELLRLCWDNDETIVDIWETRDDFDEGLLPDTRESSFKAAVNVTYGCDNFCSYCVVPYARGREKSREPDDVLAEVKASVVGGAKEILLLGQNVNSYGKGLTADIGFDGLLRRVAAVAGVERVRFMTSHPKDLSDGLIRAMAENANVCRHLHLPFQSGSSRVLGLMNRRYTKDDYLRLVDKIRVAMTDITLTTDIIVGFPGETEDDFLETLDVVERVRFGGAFTFIYSPRAGTAAAAMTDTTDEATVKERFARLSARTNAITYEINRSYEGRTVAVLAESFDGGTIDGTIDGRTDGNGLIHFGGVAELVGNIVQVKVIEGKPTYLLGELVK